MNYEELAFVNRQLAGLLQAGVPLEGALKQLCVTMRAGPGRAEFERLEADLAQGVPLEQALAARKLPAFYVAMLRVGFKANNLPAVLNLLADHYHHLNHTWMRLKGLMVYPMIVLIVALAMSAGLAVILTAVATGESAFLEEMFGSSSARPALVPPLYLVWLPVGLIAAAAGALLVGLLTPACRQWLRWRVPAFREASLAQFASALAMLLEQGCQLRDALDLLQQLEAGHPLGDELARWRELLAQGQTRFPVLTAGSRIFPPLFVWMVGSAGEDWVAGLRQAAGIYHRRAAHRIELALYAALPVAILALGVLIVVEVIPAVMSLTRMMQTLDSF